MALHRGIDSAHGEAAFDVRRFDVCNRGEKPEHGETESA
jgi:hypothetical protein